MEDTKQASIEELQDMAHKLRVHAIEMTNLSASG